MADDLAANEVVWLSNGVRGFGWGRLAPPMFDGTPPQT